MLSDCFCCNESPIESTNFWMHQLWMIMNWSNREHRLHPFHWPGMCFHVMPDKHNGLGTNDLFCNFSFAKWSDAMIGVGFMQLPDLFSSFLIYIIFEILLEQILNINKIGKEGESSNYENILYACGCCHWLSKSLV